MIKTLYFISGIIFSIGLSLSGMIDSFKVISFLDVTSPNWNPALAFVLGSAVPTYFVLFIWIKQRKKTLLDQNFTSPPPRPVDRKLVIGSAIFGAGWGLAGVCPGPALSHIAFLDVPFALFIIFMFVGFEIQRKLIK